MADSCWGLTENNKICKAIILQLKNKLIKKKETLEKDAALEECTLQKRQLEFQHIYV